MGMDSRPVRKIHVWPVFAILYAWTPAFAGVTITQEYDGAGHGPVFCSRSFRLFDSFLRSSLFRLDPRIREDGGQCAMTESR
jgi:hypothetical protein